MGASDGWYVVSLQKSFSKAQNKFTSVQTLISKRQRKEGVFNHFF